MAIINLNYEIPDDSVTLLKEQFIRAEPKADGITFEAHLHNIVKREILKICNKGRFGLMQDAIVDGGPIII